VRDRKLSCLLHGGGVNRDAVTVVIPTHNRKQLLLRTLDSVLRQRDVDLKVVVVDDCGTDGTADAVEGLGHGNVRVIRHERNGGVSAARNSGLGVVDTPWVAFVDDDDLCSPDKIGAQIDSVAGMAGSQWSCVGAVGVDANLSVISQHAAPESGDISGELLQRNAIPGGGSGVLLCTSLAREVGGFDESLSIVADWDFYLRLSLRSPVAAVNRPLVAYYVHQDSMYHDPKGLIRELFRMEEKYLNSAEGVSLQADRAVRFIHVALMAHRLGDSRMAAGMILKGVAKSGVRPIAAELIARVARKVRNHQPATFEFGESVGWWLSRYTPSA
jgi:glycosyltransferase involved in cell wall biosynthesis